MPTSLRAAALANAFLAGAFPASAQVPANWARDIPELLAAIDSIHPAPYRLHSRAEWERAAGELEARVPTLHYHEFVAELGRLVALAGDGHTRLGQVRLVDHQRAGIVPDAAERMVTRYPVEFELFADGLYVIRAPAAQQAITGRKVVAVNGVLVARAFERLLPFLSADNDAWRWYLFPVFLASPGYLAAAGLAASPAAPLRLGLEGVPGDVALAPADSAGPLVAADQPLRASGRLPWYRTVESRYAFRYLPEARTVHFRLREIQSDSVDPLGSFSRRLFAFLDSAAVDRLVIDLRRNGGGNNYLNQPLVHWLIRATKVNHPGGLFVITDRGTFSAAISLLSDIERNTHAIVVGEPAGAPANHYGDSRRIRLPESGVEVRISTVFWQGSDPRDPRQWILPDLQVPLGYADWAAGRDPMLEAILAWRADTSAVARPPNTNWRRPTQRVAPAPYVEW